MADSPTSDTVTEGIRIRAAAQYLPQLSDPDTKQYQYKYRITISNEGQASARLRTRHWIILDANNNRWDVEGEGVVGETPDLAPGESFAYESACHLPTEWGTMEGTYEMERSDGTRFDAAIGRFFLTPANPPIPTARSAEGT